MRRRAAVAAAAVVAVGLLALGVALRDPGAQVERPAVVAVRVWTTGTGPATLATGLVLARGRVLTVEHVLAGARRIEVQGEDGVRRVATVLTRRPRLDLAVLRAAGVTGPAPKFDDAGEDLRVVTTRDGVVTARPTRVRREIVARLVDQPGWPRRPSLELSVTIARGDSGAPVVDRDGAVVGIVYARSTRRAGTAYAVRAEAVRGLAG